MKEFRTDFFMKSFPTPLTTISPELSVKYSGLNVGHP